MCRIKPEGDLLAPSAPVCRGQGLKGHTHAAGRGWGTTPEPEQGQRLLRVETDELEQMFSRVQNCLGRRDSKLPGLWAEFFLCSYIILTGNFLIVKAEMETAVSAVLGC